MGRASLDSSGELMEQEIRIEVEGIPRPQGSKTIYNGRMVESSKGLPAWRKLVLEACQAGHGFGDIFFTGSVALEVDFYLPRPPSVKKTKRLRPTVPPDLDKLLRAIGDSITQSGCIWQDDSQVTQIIARKHYDDDHFPGASIKITQL